MALNTLKCNHLMPLPFKGLKVKGKVKRRIAVCKRSLRSPLRELTYHMGSHSVNYHPPEVTYPRLSQPKLVLDLATQKGCKAELT